MSPSYIDTDGRVESDHMVDVFKALGHPVRLDIMRRMVAVPELACTELEHTLPIAKPTISYHIKMLHRARLINVKKVGKYYYYTPRMDEMNELLPGLAPLLLDRLVKTPAA
jgi:DNA-binding transcriptional ArsR family regulator